MTQEVVKELRNQKGWSQSELAELSGLSVKTIQRIEHGQGAPSLDTAKALASIFDTQGQVRDLSLLTELKILNFM